MWLLSLVFVVGTTSQPLVHASEAGGLPDVSARVTVLETLVSSLQSTITTLQNDVAGLKAANNELKGALAAETSARIAADGALSQSVAQVQASVASLSDNLAAEQAARIAGDQQLAAQVASTKPQYFVATQLADFLPNGNDTVVANLEGLPAGTYLLSANLTVSNFEEDPYWDCTLYYMGQFPMHKVTTSTIGVGIIDVDAPVQSLSLQTPMTVGASSAPASVSLRCESEEPKSFVSNVKFFALRLGAE
jgi:hypothetical protein